jgi:hypothetical protein
LDNTQYTDNDVPPAQPQRFRIRIILAIVAVLVLAGLFVAYSMVSQSDLEPASAAAAAATPPAGPAPTVPEPADNGAGAAIDTATLVAPPAYDTLGPAPLVPKPDVVRALYLNAFAAGSSRKLTRLIEIANRTEINAFVIDVKEVGEISYRSGVSVAAQVGANRQYIRDVRGMLARLRQHDIYPIARIVVFRDPVLARGKPEWAIHKADGSLWQDNNGMHWVDSFNRNVWDYNIAIAREAVNLGFSEVQWDYVRFPDVPRSYMNTANWPAQEGRTKEDGIREFLLYARDKLADLEVPVTADVFGLTVTAADDMGIGQYWEKMVDAADVILPMVYPSHFAHGSYGIAVPNAEPYAVVFNAMQEAVRRTAAVPGAGTVRPWLQAFTLGQPRYGAAEIREQIRAVYDAGLKEWVLWNPSSNYIESALEADSVASTERERGREGSGSGAGAGTTAGATDR